MSHETFRLDREIRMLARVVEELNKRMVALETAIAAVAPPVDATTRSEKKKEPPPLSRDDGPCAHTACDYEVGGRWSCEYSWSKPWRPG